MSEVDEVASLMSDYRLVTVTGPGGVGKTRLAAEVARRVAGRFADGVWIVDLAAVDDPALVPSALASVLGVFQGAQVPVAESLVLALARQQVLLVLDNCEQVAAAVAELCGALLVAADDAKVLATTREPLGVAGEARYRLPPLALSKPGDLAGELQSEAVALFTERARHADSRFTLDDEVRPVVSRLVARLDGMPLAIELAAARVEALGVTQLLDRLDDRFALLAGADRLAAGRHRSLAATVDWSYRLLSAEEQRVFRWLSVFPAPFTLDSAEAVAAKAAGPVVLHLVDCSMLSPPARGADGRARYLMLETLRVFGASRLAEAGEQAEAAVAFANCLVQMAENASADMRSSARERTGALWLDAEDAAARQALGWALEHDQPSALRLAVALAPWWRLRGHAVAGSALLEQAAAHGEVGSDVWCAAQFLLGQAAVGTGDAKGALGRFTAVRDAQAGHDPSPVLVDCLSGRAHSMLNLGQVGEGGEEAAQALSLARQIGYRAGEALACLELGLAAFYAGDREQALNWARRAQRIDPSDAPGWITRLGCNYLTLFLSASGDITAARSSCANGLAQARQAGSLQDQADALELMVDLDRQAGHLADAGMHLREALEQAFQIGSRGHLVDCLDHCGLLCAATGRSAEAVTLWTARAVHLQDIGLPDAQRDAHRRHEPQQKAEQALGADQTHEAKERGQAMTLATASDFALMLAAGIEAGQPAPKPPSSIGQLSAREQQLVTLVAQGRTDAQIAEQLYISVRTVRSHLDRIRDKTGCRRRADLTRLALQAHLV